MLVQIGYELNFAAPFHFGTGISTNLLDRTVVRDAGKYLYVPASTFKGVLREHCDHLLRFYTPTEPESVASPHDANAALTELGGSTLISRIFGSQIHPGGLRFDNARQEDTARRMYETIQTSVLTQARIDRVTRTATNEALYTSEFGAPFLTFKGTIKGQLDCVPIDDLAALVADDEGEVHIVTPSYSLLLLLAGLFMIERLGGNKSTGKGQCRCTIEQVLLDRHKCTEEEWRPWIERLDMVSNYAQTEKGGQQ